MHLVEIIVFSCNHHTITIIDRSDKKWGIFLENKAAKDKKFNYKGWTPKKRKFRKIPMIFNTKKGL